MKCKGLGVRAPAKLILGPVQQENSFFCNVYKYNLKFGQTYTHIILRPVHLAHPSQNLIGKLVFCILETFKRVQFPQYIFPGLEIYIFLTCIAIETFVTSVVTSLARVVTLTATFSPPGNMWSPIYHPHKPLINNCNILLYYTSTTTTTFPIS